MEIAQFWVNFMQKSFLLGSSQQLSTSGGQLEDKKPYIIYTQPYSADAMQNRSQNS